MMPDPVPPPPEHRETRRQARKRRAQEQAKLQTETEDSDPFITLSKSYKTRARAKCIYNKMTLDESSDASVFREYSEITSSEIESDVETNKLYTTVTDLADMSNSEKVTLLYFDKSISNSNFRCTESHLPCSTQ